MLDDLRTALSTFEIGKVDVTVDTSMLRVHGGNLKIPIMKGKPSRELQFTEHSFSQLCTKLNLPVKYMRRCFDEDVDLFDENVNYWLGKLVSDKASLLRTRGNTLRALLSDKYSILDNCEIFKVLYAVMQDGAEFPEGLFDLKIKDFYMDENYFQLRCIFPEPVYMDNRRKDPCFIGVNIINSETGCKRVTIEIVIWRQICSNGMVISESEQMLFSKRHLYVNRESLAIDFYNAVKLAREVGSNYMQSFKNTKKFTFSNEDDLTVRVNQILLGKPQELIEIVLSNVSEKSDYGIINALTYTAQALPFEKRYDMEKIAGEFLIGKR